MFIASLSENLLQSQICQNGIRRLSCITQYFNQSCNDKAKTQNYHGRGEEIWVWNVSGLPKIIRVRAGTYYNFLMTQITPRFMTLLLMDHTEKQTFVSLKYKRQR